MYKDVCRYAVSLMVLMLSSQAFAIGSRVALPELPHAVSLVLPDRVLSGQGLQMFEPIPGARVSSPFGWRVHPVLHEIRFHPAMDFAASRGTKVLAAAEGTITRVGRSSDLGLTVNIRHADNTQTAYAHMSAFARGLRVGQTVRAHQVIGKVGSTGLSTGPHLDFQVLVDGERIDPSAMIAQGGPPMFEPVVRTARAAVRVAAAIVHRGSRRRARA